jgi:hypothetical protein
MYALLLLNAAAFVVPNGHTLAPHPPLGDDKTDLFLKRSSDIDKRDSSPSPPKAIIEYNDFLPQPNPEWDAPTVLQACMDALLRYRTDDRAAGLEVCFNFSSDRCRASFDGSLDRFTAFSSNPVFSCLVNCQAYEIVSIGPVIASSATRGAMQTVLMDAMPQQPKEAVSSSSSSSGRRFLWTFQQERRPPRQGCWIIHEVIYVKNAFHQTL